jgi:hypothetical protein
MVSLKALRREIHLLKAHLLGRGALVGHRRPVRASMNNRRATSTKPRPARGISWPSRNRDARSRSSARTLRTKGKILQILESCPRVVDALGYGRVEHFEYLAVTLEGPSLNAIAKDKRLSGHTIAVLASQMVCEAALYGTVIKATPARSALLPSR